MHVLQLGVNILNILWKQNFSYIFRMATILCCEKQQNFKQLYVYLSLIIRISKSIKLHASHIIQQTRIISDM